MKLFYLSFYVAAGVYFPYVGLYLRSLHYSGAQIGLIAALAPLASLLLPSLWGTLSDRLGWRKPLLIVSLLLATFAAPVVSQVHAFAAVLGLFILLAVTLSPSVPLADATTLEWLRGHGGSYGSVRLYGSLGFLLSSLISGSFFTGEHIARVFPVYGVCLFGAFLVSLSVPRQERLVRLAQGEGLVSVLQDRVVVQFLLCAVLGYAAFAAYNIFFSLYLQGLGASTTVVGLAAGIATLSELPMMAMAGWLIRRVGVKPLLVAALSAGLIRWIAYALLHDYRLALIFQVLHGPAFAGFYVAGVTFMEQRVPARLRATGQALFNSAIFGVGSVTGTSLFGVLFDHVHAAGIFLVASAISTTALLGMALFLPKIVTISAE